MQGVVSMKTLLKNANGLEDFVTCNTKKVTEICDVPVFVPEPWQPFFWIVCLKLTDQGGWLVGAFDRLVWQVIPVSKLKEVPARPEPMDHVAPPCQHVRVKQNSR